ncbi:IS3 family transposase [Brevibacterium sp. JNUCC-42]|nr:IS3 family transposase [Brevibacterium sp. JNUCC-42]
MREEGYSRREVMETLGIRNVTQLKTWMKWYRNGETHRFHQPVGKQYSFGKGPSDLSEIEQKDIEIRQLRAKVPCAGKVRGGFKEVGPEVVVDVIHELHKSFTIKELCFILGIPRSTYYRWRQRNWHYKDEIERAVIALCEKHKRRYGYRRITAAVRKQLDKSVNHKRVLRIMKENNMLSKVRKKKKVYLTGQDPVIVENLIQRDFSATNPNQKWFTDVSYLLFGEELLYFSSIIDTYNNEIISYKVSKRQDISLALDTLTEACRNRDVQGVVLHSDQGGIYTSKRFQQYAKEKGITTSMSRKGNCHDNAAIESFHSHFKSEAFYAQEIKKISTNIVLELVDEYIHYYNNERIQGKLNYLSPVEYRQQVG